MKPLNEQTITDIQIHLFQNVKGILCLKTTKGKVGIIHFIKENIMHARIGRLVGMQALEYLLTLEECEIKYSRGTEFKAQTTIDEHFVILFNQIRKQQTEAINDISDLQLSLHVLSGQSEGLSFELSQSPVVIGREKGSGICIPDITVSDKHAYLKIKSQDEMLIKDASSSNGLYIKNEKVNSHQLSLYEPFRIGQVLLEITPTVVESTPNLTTEFTAQDQENTGVSAEAPTEALIFPEREKTAPLQLFAPPSIPYSPTKPPTLVNLKAE